MSGFIETEMKQKKKTVAAAEELIILLGKQKKKTTESPQWERRGQGSYPSSKSTKERVTLQENRASHLQEAGRELHRIFQKLQPDSREC